MIIINEWRVNPDNCTLHRMDGRASDADTVRIPPRSMDVLMYLAERPGQVVSTEALLDAFWVSSSTTDHAVHKVIASLRAALGDDPHNPRFIKTLPRRGYSLIAPVSAEQEEKPAAPQDPMSPRAPTLPVPSRQRLLAALALAAVLVAGTASWWILTEGRVDAPAMADSDERQVKRIALVPPLRNPSVAAREYNQIQALLDSLAVDLRRLPELDVIVADTGMTGEEAARDLEAGFTLDTSLHRGVEELRLTLNLVRREDNANLYARRFTLDDTRLASVEQEVIPTITRSLSIHLDEERLREMRAWSTNNAEAYRHFLRGEYFAEQYNHRDWLLALEQFDKAITEDPQFINAYLGKATAANNMAVYSRNDRVEELAREVLELTRELALVAPESEAIETLKMVRMRIEGSNEWQQERKYREQIRSGEAAGYIYARYALYLIGARLYREAEAYLELAQQSEVRRLTPNAAWNFRTQTLPPEELAEVKVQQLVDRPLHIGILGTAISSLAYSGNVEKAEYLLKRQQEYDLDGVRAHLSEVLLGAATGKLQLRQCPDLFSPAQLQDPDLAFNNGVLFFLLGEFEEGAAYWRDLTRIDKRKLYQRLHAIEPFFPDTVHNNPRYVALLDELKAGRNWQRRLMEGVMELSEHTGVPLSPAARQHYAEETFMGRNNLWGLNREATASATTKPEESGSTPRVQSRRLPL